MTEAPLFTVFTATYNRAHTLPRVYESLCRQTFREFEWVIVDDGSTDNTQELVSAWIAQGRVPIRYFRQPNQGKHVALNRGAREARGVLFINFDSDDACVPEALETLRRHWFDIPAAERRHFSAVTALARYADERTVGDAFPESPMDGFPTYIRVKHRVEGDKWGFQTTAAWREFPLPEHPGEKFIPEAAALIRIGAKYKTRFVNDRLLIVYEDGGERLSRRITQLRIRNPRGTLDYYREYACERMPWREKIKALINLSRFAFHARRWLEEFKNSPYPTLHLLSAPLGWLMYRRDRTTPHDRP